MSYLTKLTLALYALFGFLGLWLGNDGYTLSHASGYASTIHEMFGLLTYVVGLAGTSLFTFLYITTESKNYSDIISDPLHQLSCGIWLTGSMIFYGYAAGPFHEHGALMNPWMILPLMSLLPLLTALIAHTSASSEADTTCSAQLTESK